MLGRHGIENVGTTVKNPQSNALCKQMHQTILNVLRVIMRTTERQNENDVNQVVENALATCTHATRCAVNNVLKCSPGALVFCRDMFVDVPIIADLLAIRDRRQLLIDENLRRQN